MVTKHSKINMKEAAVKNITIDIWEIKGICKKHGVDTDSLWNDILRRISLGRLVNASGMRKRSGASAVDLFETALAVKLFSIGSVVGYFAKSMAGTAGFEKSALYRFLQNGLVDWRAALYELGKQLRPGEGKNAGTMPTAFILDDSPVEKSGRRIEGISSIHDHAAGRFVLGFKLLALAWFDGATCRVLDCAPVKEGTKALKKVKRKFRKRRGADSPGAKRKAEMGRDKISLAISMLKRAVRKGFVPQYVLADSWFTCLLLIKVVRSLAKGCIHFLGMVKFMKRKYEWRGRLLSLAELRKANMAHVKRCRRFRSRYLQIDCVLPGFGEVRLFVSRYAGSRKWVALLTTDMSMTYVKAIETYMIRWNIEVCFKEVKQLLGLGKCQSRDFDSQVAHFALVFMAHSLLVDMKAREEYRSLGILFESLGGQRRAAIVAERLIAAFEEFLDAAAESMGGADKVTVGELMRSDIFAVFKNILSGTLTDYCSKWNLSQVPDNNNVSNCNAA